MVMNPFGIPKLKKKTQVQEHRRWAPTSYGNWGYFTPIFVELWALTYNYSTRWTPASYKVTTPLKGVITPVTNL